MTDATAEDIEAEVPKSSKLTLVLSIVALLVGLGGGFFVMFSGLLFGADSTIATTEKTNSADMLADVAFIPMEPIIVSLNTGGDGQHLQFRAELEVPSQYADDVTEMLPRVTDVLNSYLRALSPSDVTSSSALLRLRAQMLRRAEIVLGSHRINDLLVMEFVVN